MTIEMEDGVVVKVDYFRKAYRKARWKRKASRIVRSDLRFEKELGLGHTKSLIIIVL